MDLSVTASTHVTRQSSVPHLVTPVHTPSRSKAETKESTSHPPVSLPCTTGLTTRDILLKLSSHTLSSVLGMEQFRNRRSEAQGRGPETGRIGSGCWWAGSGFLAWYGGQACRVSV